MKCDVVWGQFGIKLNFTKKKKKKKYKEENVILASPLENNRHFQIFCGLRFFRFFCIRKCSVKGTLFCWIVCLYSHY